MILRNHIGTHDWRVWTVNLYLKSLKFHIFSCLVGSRKIIQNLLRVFNREITWLLKGRRRSIHDSLESSTFCFNFFLNQIMWANVNNLPVASWHPGDIQWHRSKFPNSHYACKFFFQRAALYTILLLCMKKRMCAARWAFLSILYDESWDTLFTFCKIFMGNNLQSHEMVLSDFYVIKVLWDA